MQALFTHFCLVQVEAIRLQLQGSGHRHFLFRFVLSPFQRKHQDECALFIALVHLGFNAMCVGKVAPMVPERRQQELVSDDATRRTVWKQANDLLLYKIWGHRVVVRSGCSSHSKRKRPIYDQLLRESRRSGSIDLTTARHLARATFFPDQEQQSIQYTRLLRQGLP